MIGDTPYQSVPVAGHLFPACVECGAIVWDTDKHDDFHAMVDRMFQGSRP